MLESPQRNGLSIQHIDAETGAIRPHSPDFVIALDDGTIQIIEVRGGNKTDDVVVRTKAAAAGKMAWTSKMECRGVLM